MEDSSLENQTQVTFNRPSDETIKIYTWRANDLTGTVTAPDDVTDIDDFYEGLFNSDFYWVDSDNNRVINPSDTNQYNYGYVVGPMGGTWAINWSKW